MLIIRLIILTILTLSLYNFGVAAKKQACHKQSGYLRCLDGYYKKIENVNITTNEPIFVGRIELNDLENLPFYFRKFSYYSIKTKVKKAMKYEYFVDGNKDGEFYFAFYKKKAQLGTAIWYNKKGQIKELHNYAKIKEEYHINTFLYYNDFGMLIRKEKNIYRKGRFIKKEIDTNLIVEDKIPTQN